MFPPHRYKKTCNYNVLHVVNYQYFKRRWEPFFIVIVSINVGNKSFVIFRQYLVVKRLKLFQRPFLQHSQNISSRAIEPIWSSWSMTIDNPDNCLLDGGGWYIQYLSLNICITSHFYNKRWKDGGWYKYEGSIWARYPSPPLSYFSRPNWVCSCIGGDGLHTTKGLKSN